MYVYKFYFYKSSLLFGFFFFFFLFLGPHPQHMEVPRLGGPIRATAAGQHHSHSNTRSLTHGARPGIEAASSLLLVRFISAVLQRELSLCCFLFYFIFIFIFIFLSFFFFFLLFLGPPVWHMEVLRLGVESEL